MVPADFTAIAFDLGGVTTGPMTVPFILALGIGFPKKAGQDLPGSFSLTGKRSVKETCGGNNVLNRYRLRSNEPYSDVYLLFITAKCRHIRKAAGIAYAELSGDSGKKEIGFRFCQM